MTIDRRNTTKVRINPNTKKELETLYPNIDWQKRLEKVTATTKQFKQVEGLVNNVGSFVYGKKTWKKIK